MHFAFNSEQIHIRDSVRSVLNAKSPPSVIRSGAEAVWDELVALGVLGLELSEAAGGLGLGPCEWVGVCEEAGRAALSLPLTETLALLPFLEQIGQTELATQVAGGEQHIALGAPHAVDADRADAVFRLLPPSGPTPARVERLLTPVCTRLESVCAQRRLFAVEGEPSHLPGDASSVHNRLLVGTAAELVGLASKQLELAVAYVKARQQFGKAVGSFQAVQHHLANALLELSFARPVVYRAAWSLATASEDATLHAAMAKAKASDAAHRVRRLTLQVHGAIGYTLEYDLHLWMKRSMALESAWGTAIHHRARIAELFHLPGGTVHV